MRLGESDDMTPVLGPVGHVLCVLLGALLAAAGWSRALRRWLP